MPTARCRAEVKLRRRHASGRTSSRRRSLKVAETLDEFRGHHAYNLLDENLRRFNAEVPQIWQWDDHEVTNNWSDSKALAPTRATRRRASPMLAASGDARLPRIRADAPHDADERERVYRKLPYGPQLDVFVLDMRSYRGPNTREPADAARRPRPHSSGATQIALAEARAARSRTRRGR